MTTASPAAPGGPPTRCCRDYHDTEWGVPIRGEAAHFERLTLEAFQSGLSWRTILAKRESFRAAFAGFDADAVAAYDDGDRARLMADAGIVRNRLKVDAAITNAAATVALRESGGLEAFVAGFRPERQPAPRTTERDGDHVAGVGGAVEGAEEAGFVFVGPTTMYALMEAIGLVDDHLVGCHRRGGGGSVPAERGNAVAPHPTPGSVTPMARVHAFSDDDVLGRLDAVGLAELIQARRVSIPEVVEAATGPYGAGRRAARRRGPPRRRRRPARGRSSPRGGFFAGVPTFVKDNVDVAGMPTMQGGDAWEPRPRPADGELARMYLATGLLPLGKSQLSEFGFSASAEHPRLGPVRSPWDLDLTAGASSAGSAALVAAGAVPIAHANDGGGSIRIPASVNGLVGLKPTRGRLAQQRDDPADARTDRSPTASSPAASATPPRSTGRRSGSTAHLRLPPVGDVSRPGSDPAPGRRGHRVDRHQRRPRGRRPDLADRRAPRGARPPGRARRPARAGEPARGLPPLLVLPRAGGGPGRSSRVRTDAGTPSDSTT